MSDDKKFISGIDLIYLTSCALNGKTPDAARVSEMDLSSVYKLSARHSMQAVSYFPVESLIRSNSDFSIDEDLLRQWKEDKNKAVRKLILFDAEREKIFEFMNKNGIWHMPLKGVVLQKFYPKFGMRQITDNDILFDENHRDALCEYMRSAGYECKPGGRTTHDVYLKPPVLNFEMHISLYSPMTEERWHLYYKNVKERLVPLGEHLFGFTDDDLYTYIVTHFYKHYRYGGSGIRSLMDVYVLNKNLGEKLDREYISSELKKLNVDDFEKDVRALADKIFDPSFDVSSLDERSREILDITIFSGTHGTQERAVKTQLERITDGDKNITFSVKLRLLLRYLFPDMEYYREMHPFLYKYKIFIPFFVVYRIVKAPFKRWDFIKSVLSALFKKKK